MTFRDLFAVGSERIGDAHRLTLVGELDIATAPILERAFVAVARTDAEIIAVDLSGLTFMDSTGLRALLEMAEACEEGRLRIGGLTAHLERLLAITGVRALLPIVPAGADPLAPRSGCRA